MLVQWRRPVNIKMAVICLKFEWKFKAIIESKVFRDWSIFTTRNTNTIYQMENI